VEADNEFLLEGVGHVELFNEIESALEVLVVFLLLPLVVGLHFVFAE